MGIVQVSSLEEFKLQEVAALRGQLAYHERAEAELRDRLGVLGAAVVEPKPAKAPEPREDGHEAEGETPKPSKVQKPPQPLAESRKPAKAKRIAVCHICRSNFDYTKKGPIPKKPECGRANCRPVDAGHRRDRDRNERM